MENQYFTENDEKRLGKIVKTALNVKPSIPSRSYCPAPEVIQALAFNMELDAATVKNVTLHIAECYKCSQLADKYLRQYQNEQKNRSDA